MTTLNGNIIKENNNYIGDAVSDAKVACEKFIANVKNRAANKATP